MNFTIRAGELGDGPALASLISELGYKTSSSEMESRLKRIFDDPHYRTFVAVSDGKVCGMIGTGRYDSYEHNDPSGRILALVVSKVVRNQGIGRALVAAAEKDFVARKIRRVALNTRLTREDAHRFYESLGYARNGFRFVKEL